MQISLVDRLLADPDLSFDEFADLVEFCSACLPDKSIEEIKIDLKHALSD